VKTKQRKNKLTLCSCFSLQTHQNTLLLVPVNKTIKLFRLKHAGNGAV
jgi:hypothetical protein